MASPNSTSPTCTVEQSLNILRQYGSYTLTQLVQNVSSETLCTIFESVGTLKLPLEQSDVTPYGRSPSWSTNFLDNHSSEKWSDDLVNTSTTEGLLSDLPISTSRTSFLQHVGNTDDTPPPEKARTLPPNDQKRDVSCLYPCIMGTCKSYPKPASRKSHRRHEKMHWFRWICRQCHSSRTELLQEIERRPRVVPKSEWVDLENCRLERGQKLAKLYNRGDLLTTHLTKDHDMSDYEAEQFAEKSMFKIKDVTACGICKENFLLSGYEDTERHMWKEHWLQRHDMSVWSEDLVIWKLLTLQPGLSEVWESTIGLLNPCGPNHFTWQNTDTQNLRLELEARRLSDPSLSSMAFNKATYLGTDPNETRCKSPSASVFESVNHNNDANVDRPDPMRSTLQTDTYESSFGPLPDIWNEMG
ncbi:MAG: hypothetical protein Q9167_005345 [Letrouitia subvulpina]